MKLKYDLAIPLGEACSSTESLREAGLQLLSFPHDWIAAILRKRFRVADYRTRGERMAWLRRRILKALRLSRLVSAART